MQVVEGRDQGGKLPLADGGTRLLRRVARRSATSRSATPTRRVSTSRYAAAAAASRCATSARRTGTWLGDASPRSRAARRFGAQRRWPRIGRTVLALVEPVDDALAQLESRARRGPRAGGAGGSAAAGGSRRTEAVSPRSAAGADAAPAAMPAGNEGARAGVEEASRDLVGDGHRRRERGARRARAEHRRARCGSLRS